MTRNRPSEHLWTVSPFYLWNKKDKRTRSFMYSCDDSIRWSEHTAIHIRWTSTTFHDCKQSGKASI